MENKKLIGKKVKGFKFDGEKYRCGYSSLMDNNIGIVGTIQEYEKSTNVYVVNFEKDNWNYPAELIEQHIVESNEMVEEPKEHKFENYKECLSKCNEDCFYHCSQAGTQAPDCLNKDPKEHNPIDPLGILDKVFVGENVNEKDVIGDNYIEILKIFNENDFKLKPMCLSAEEIETPDYYDNSKGSLCKIAEQRKWNAYIFDVVKRLDRGGKKDPLKQEIEKSIAVLQLWLKELDK